MKTLRHCSFFLLLVVLTACDFTAADLPLASESQTPAAFPTPSFYDRIPASTGDGWQTASPVQAGLDPAWLGRMLEAIYRGPGTADTRDQSDGRPKFENIYSLLIARGGKLVFEEYFYGFGERNAFDTASVTKSFLSLLVGQAIEQGFLPGIEEPVLTYFPDYAPAPPDPRLETLTLADLLTMRHGLACDDWSVESLTYWRKDLESGSDDMIRTVFGLPLAIEPGTHFSYCSLAVDLLGALLERATGEAIPSFADRNLFAPLGIAPAFWRVLPGGWTDAAGNVTMTARDMARIGQLVLQGGRWQGQTVVPQEWLRASTQAHVVRSSGLGWGNGYGYLWWLSEVRVHGTVVRAISASGAGGQVITVFPALDTVVVITGGNYQNDEGQPFQIMEKFILPAVVP